MSIETLTSRYQLTARSQGLSEKTVQFTGLGVKLFDNFMGGITDVRKVKADDLRRFILALQQKERWSGCPQGRAGGKLSATTVNTYTRAVKGFWSWLERDGQIKANPLATVKSPKLPKLLPKCLTEKELIAVLKSCRSKRETAMVLFFADSGLRLSELINITLDNVDLANGTAMVFGKGSKQRQIYFSPQTAIALDTYIRSDRPESNLGNLFLSEEGMPLKKTRIDFIFEELGKRAGVKLSPHRLRHTSATMRLRAGDNLENVRIALGHSDIKITQRYLGVNDVDMATASKKFSPIANLGIRPSQVNSHRTSEMLALAGGALNPAFDQRVAAPLWNPRAICLPASWRA